METTQKGLSPNTIEDPAEYKHYCSVRELLEFIKENNIPEDAKICVQRVPDMYYNGSEIAGRMSNAWSTVKKETRQANFTWIEEYTPAWCPVNYKDGHLYLDLHY